MTPNKHFDMHATYKNSEVWSRIDKLLVLKILQNNKNYLTDVY